MSRRWTLWGLLALLLAALLGLLVWLAGRYEQARWQDGVEREAHEAAAEIRAGLLRNVQSLHALTQPTHSAERFRDTAQSLLRERREMLRIERRSNGGHLLEQLNTPYLPQLLLGHEPGAWSADAQQACSNARRLSTPAYAPSEFVPQGQGTGLEMMMVCVPLVQDGQPHDLLLAYYSLSGILAEWVPAATLKGQEVSFTEGDGTRLAIHGRGSHGLRQFAAQSLLDLPGNPLVLRLDSWRSTPGLFPNVLTALVATLSLGLVAVMALLARDMRRRQQAERELAQAFAFRKAMEDSLVTGLRARDLQGRITYVNPAFCEMVGFEAPELIGQSIPAPYWPPEQIDEYRARQAIRLAGVAPPREGYESLFMRKDGQRFPVLIFEAPLIDNQGHQTGWMSAILDMTEQRRVEDLSRASTERLQATARLATVGEMASLLSHELNQPLAAIASYATGSLNLLEPAPDAHTLADVQEALQRIAAQADRAGRVIRSVHDFVRRRHEDRQSVPLPDLIEAVRPLIELQARKCGCRVRVDIAPGLPPAHCDRTMVEQVLLNLARNGIQAMQTSASGERLLHIRVQAQPSAPPQPASALLPEDAAQAPTAPAALPAWLQCSVSDRGAGIDPDIATQLFTPFFTTKAEGMGLGLSLCRTVIEQHGGILEHQANPDGGTVFVFTLPSARPGAAPSPQQDPAAH